MALSSQQSLDLLLVVTGLFLAARACGAMFVRLRQPAVVGEVLGGFLLGPTVLGLSDLGALHRTTEAQVGALAFLGLLMLMFRSGSEIALAGTRIPRGFAPILTLGLTVPLLLGLAAATVVDLDPLSGPNSTPESLGLILGVGAAVTSIPVISRIMLDLGLMRTPFARLVVGLAVVDDVVLYVLLAIALSLAAGQDAHHEGLVGLIPNVPEWAVYGYHAAASMLFFLITLRYLCPLMRLVPGVREAVGRGSTSVQLGACLAMALLAGAVGVNLIFGGLVAGVAMAWARRHELAPHRDAPQYVPSEPAAPPARLVGAESFFVPLYFASVGAQLDLRTNFDLGLLLVFLLGTSVVKMTAVWAGARLARLPVAVSNDLAIALNCRGGPGIVLASVAYAEGVISQDFFACLVITALVTSQVSGWWLGRSAERLARLRLDESTSHAGDSSLFPLSFRNAHRR